MSKLPQVPGRTCIKALQKLGFATIQQRGSHVKLIRTVDNRKQTVIVPIHKILKPGTLRNGILKPINLSVDDFVSLLH